MAAATPGTPPSSPPPPTGVARPPPLLCFPARFPPPPPLPHPPSHRRCAARRARPRRAIDARVRSATARAAAARTPNGLLTPPGRPSHPIPALSLSSAGQTALPASLRSDVGKRGIVFPVVLSLFCFSVFAAAVPAAALWQRLHFCFLLLLCLLFVRSACIGILFAVVLRCVGASRGWVRPTTPRPFGVPSLFVPGRRLAAVWAPNSSGGVRGRPRSITDNPSSPPLPRSQQGASGCAVPCRPRRRDRAYHQAPTMGATIFGRGTG